MTIVFSGSGGIFTRLGKIIFAKKMLHEFGGGSAIDNISAASTSWVEELKDALDEIQGAAISEAIRATGAPTHNALDSFQSSVSTLQRALTLFAENLVIEQVDADNGLSSKDILTALKELKRQMIANSATIDVAAPSIAVSYVAANEPTPGDNDNIGAIVTSLLNDEGRVFPGVFAENIVCECTSDTTSGGETFTVRGEEAVFDRHSPNWPGGSGAATSLVSNDAANASQNYLTDGALENWTAGALDSWTALAGSYGVDILEEASVIYKGAKGLEFNGDGATTTGIEQQLTGLVGRQVLAICLFYRIDVQPAAGVLSIQLHDGTSLIQNDLGANLTATVDLSTISTVNTWFALTGLFRLPIDMPASVFLRVRQTTPISATTSCFVDHISVVDAVQLYAGGPYAALFSGAQDWTRDDRITLAVTNDRRNALGSWIDAMFENGANNIILPAASSGTINDNLIA